MPKIITDGTRLLYECILCHQYKPVELIENHSNIYVCRSCDAAPQVEFTIIPTVQQKTVILPPPEEFNLFFDDVLFYKSEPISSLTNNILTLTNPQNKKIIQLNTTALLQVLVDKFNHPAIHESTLTQNVDLQLYMQDLYLTVQEKNSQCINKFNKILAFEDARIKELCVLYHEMQTIPLNLKLKYQEWEKTLVSGHIIREINKQMSEKDKQITQIQTDYSKKLEDEKIKNNAVLEKYKNRVQKLETTVESLNSSRASAKEELNIAKTEKEELYTRYKALEKQFSEKEAETIKMTIENTKLKKEVDKHKETEEWSLDITSTDDEKIFFNQITNKYITCPADLKENYRPESANQEGDILVYKEKNGDKKLEIPKSLLKFMKTIPVTTVENMSPIIGTKLKENTLKIINTLSRFKESALTKEQILEKTKLPSSHVMDYIKEGTEAGKIIMFKDEEGNKKYYLI